MTTDILSPAIDSSISVAVSQSHQKELTPEVTNLLERVKYWEIRARRDQLIRVIGYGANSMGKEWRERNAIDATLLPGELDELGIPKEGFELEKICREAARELLKRSPQAFKGWVECHDNNPDDWRTDHNDPRVVGISLAAQRLMSLKKSNG